MTTLEFEGRAVSLLDGLAHTDALNEAVLLLSELAQLRWWLPVSEHELRGLALEALGRRRVGGMRPDRIVAAVFDWLAR